jgi:Glycosidases
MEGCDRGKAPFIYTKPVDGNDGEFLICIENGAKEVVVLWQNSFMKKGKGLTVVNPSTVKVTVPANAKKMERSYIRAYMANENGIGNDLLVPLNYGKVINDPSVLKRTDWHSQVLYSLMIDRFVNGNTANDWKLNSPLVHPKLDYWGGDIAGVTKTIESGYFDDLGITTIWLSPIVQNPYDAWGQIHDPETKFTGYHGYWPYYATKVDDRYGTEDELRELLDKAHADNKNVLVDYVSNHMHIQSPTLTEHPDWTTPSDTPDGRPNRQLYDEFRLTTWFDDHIPTLDLERADICAQLTDSALYWMQHFDFDGFRHDATKHVPEQYWRMLTRKLHDSLPGRSFYQIGETYGSQALINSYVKPGMQTAQFDFNVYDTFIWASTRPDGDFAGLARCIQSDLDVYGYHHLMGNITGNHDRTRYVCLASGDVKDNEDQKLAGWHRDIKVTDPVGYAKLKLLHALNFTIPGVPCIYYGDEFGQPGANDPDNRRWMQFEGLSDDEQDVLDCVKDLSALRRSSLPLLYGDYYELASGKDYFAYMRIYMGKFIIVFLNCSEEDKDIEVKLPKGLSYDGMSSFIEHVAPVSYDILNN